MSPLRTAALRAIPLALLVAALGGRLLLDAQDTTPRLATGRVFHDQDGDGVWDDGEPLLEGIRVSDGERIVRTNAAGEWSLPIGADSIYFVVKPRGWRTPVGPDQLPRFYYIHKPHGSPPNLKYPGVAPTGPLPERIDFPLYPQREPERFRAVLFGDPQPRDLREVEYIAHDVVEELVGTDASFGVTLGDIVFDDLSLFEAQAKVIALLGIPWYNVIGNHDINLDARLQEHSDETFERVFGPSYYSFDHGPVHFLVLDDIEWLYDDAKGKGSYRGGLGRRQLDFIRNDLAELPDDQLVVLMMHIPLVEVHDRQELYRLIERRPFSLSISGHTHYHQHRFITHEDGWRGAEPHHHIINVTVSGSWWSGMPDERGIPHTMMADGAPNGYSIIEFDGTRYSLDFFAAGRSADYQLRIDLPEQLTASQWPETDLFVNVFNGSERSVVEYRVDNGEWRPCERTVAIDPHYERLAKSENSSPAKTWRDLPKPTASGHLWKARLTDAPEAGTHLVEVRTTDMHGRSFHGRRALRVVPSDAAKPLAELTLGELMIEAHLRPKNRSTRDNLDSKAVDGRATAEELSKLLTIYQELPKRVPARPDVQREAWIRDASRLPDAVQAVIDGTPDARSRLAAALDCKACHAKYR